MKKTMLILSLILLIGCSKQQAKDIPLSQVLEEIKVIAEFNNTQTADLTDQKVAAQYGIDPTSISEGYVYYSTEGNTADEVIVARAASRKEVENVEKAISGELTAKSTAWKSNEKESKKIENHVMRTIGDCVLLAIGDKSTEIEQVFNQLKSQ
ncbi:MAG: DUF4358 domain-containing protein [Clostridia bacterium]|nr:DUF4358 domain-containing protein [Clostridia bacterium]